MLLHRKSIQEGTLPAVLGSVRADRQAFLTVHLLELQLEEEEKLAENVCFSTAVGLHSAVIDLMCNIKSLQRIDLAKEGSTNYVFKE